MQGLNPITMQCTYSTPCGYCCKWDKKCDKKIPIDCTLTPNDIVHIYDNGGTYGLKKETTND